MKHWLINASLLLCCSHAAVLLRERNRGTTYCKVYKKKPCRHKQKWKICKKIKPRGQCYWQQGVQETEIRYNTDLGAPTWGTEHCWVSCGVNISLLMDTHTLSNMCLWRTTIQFHQSMYIETHCCASKVDSTQQVTR